MHVNRPIAAILAFGVLVGGGALLFPRLRAVHGQQAQQAQMQLQTDGPTYAGAQLNTPLVPVWRGLSPAIGTSSFSGLTILSGLVTAGCANGTVTIPSPLPSGNTYGVAVLPVTALGTGDRILETTASLGTDLQTITINRCNLQAVSLSGTTAVRYLVLVYALP